VYSVFVCIQQFGGRKWSSEGSSTTSDTVQTFKLAPNQTATLNAKKKYQTGAPTQFKVKEQVIVLQEYIVV